MFYVSDPTYYLSPSRSCLEGIDLAIRMPLVALLVKIYHHKCANTKEFFIYLYIYLLAGLGTFNRPFFKSAWYVSVGITLAWVILTS